MFVHFIVNVCADGSWNFTTDGMDIGFGIFRRTCDARQKAADMEEMLRSERVNSHMVPESGSITCSKPGTCRSCHIGHELIYIGQGQEGRSDQIKC